jgi:hypothetical protein
MATAAQLRKIFKPILNQHSVPRVPQVTDGEVVITKHPIGQPIVPHELLDCFYDFQLGTFRRQRLQRDIAWLADLAREVPSGLIKQQRSLLSGADHTADFSQTQLHRCGVAK